MFPEKIAISLVTRMSRHCRIGHDRFRSSGCDLQKSPRLFHDLITDIVETSLLRLGDDFLVGQGGLRSRIPVDHPATAINQSLAVKIDKNLLHCADVISVQRVALPRPIARTAQALELLNDDPPMLLLPIQYATEKFVATQVVTGFLFCLPQIFFDCGLGADPGVIGAGQPKNFETPHARPARKNVLDSIVEHMS